MRIMVSLAASLVVVGLAFNVPFDAKTPRPPSWRALGRHSVPASELQLSGSDAAFGIPIMERKILGPPADVVPLPVEKEPKPEREAEADSAREVATPSIAKVTAMPVLDFVDNMPTIQGGLAAYYIHIEYPEEARMRGIEGRLTLSFIVERNGTTSDVKVERGLHPLCDSAAVRALRHTVFIPGQHRGSAKRVRMRLPVRFVLVHADSVDQDIG